MVSPVLNPAAAQMVVLSGHLLGAPGEPLRRLRMPAATVAQLRTWFQTAVDSLDGTYECAFPWDQSADPVTGTARDETFCDWVITGFHRNCFPAEASALIAPLDAPLDELDRPGSRSLSLRLRP